MLAQHFRNLKKPWKQTRETLFLILNDFFWQLNEKVFKDKDFFQISYQ